MCPKNERRNYVLLHRARKEVKGFLSTGFCPLFHQSLPRHVGHGQRTQPGGGWEEPGVEKMMRYLAGVEDGTAKLVDGDEVFAQIQSRYGFKA